MSVTNFPPVRAPGKRQQAFYILAGQALADESKWKSFDFSEAFTARYGRPVVYWSHWNRLMSTPYRTELVPRFRGTFNEVLDNMNFLSFCQAVDQKAVHMKGRVLGRLEMEGLYAQFLIKKFDEVGSATYRMRVILKKSMEKVS
ncbi:hypothetical protein M430DRAFT_266710 [Amorphotheca resinae ATCC 22711]|jgi:hypothetical protein|uniref:Uncharacterized protein n=1 Tax=Amorphotheca resinae ATCC 22711 TaxID=857342 RepID=A0A2T3AX31_AMORE|nr:hypothetical protein M430DRAFT_266710 [Amorphotheca resinae ATCC 22711]PSS13232.1 hypothetical protein M430DRAFT_266710 [Amorphotheca resinae ATCC 22711]